MSQLVETHRLTPDTPLPAAETYQVYNGLDSCVTHEIFGTLHNIYGREGVPQQWKRIYDFERALQAPYLSIMRRGFAVDRIGRQLAATELHRRIDVIQGRLNQFGQALGLKGVNPRSPKQLQSLFYQSLHLPEVWISQKGERKLSTNREALEKLQVYMHAQPFVNAILAIRDLAKQLEVFETEIDSDGRFRASYNIAGTETGRPSSSSNAFGTGRNAQNIAPGLRHVFVADPGYRLCVIDLEQVEARDVGFFIGCLFGDWKFLDNCESGDLHTNNAKLIWPGLPWTGDRKADREVADRLFYREFSYRDMAKRGGHLSNYSGTAWTAARSLKVPLAIMEEFQARYCRGGWVAGQPVEPAFPGIARWWQWIAEQVQTTHQILTPFGRLRTFFGRPNDDTTIREAIADLPQSTTADRMNLGLWRVWRHEPRVQLLAQTYDSITFQFPETEDEDDIIQHVLQLLDIPLFAPNGRRYSVPGEAKVGWNWGYAYSADDAKADIAKGRKPKPLNPDGLAKWRLGKPDTRKRALGLDRIMPSATLLL